MEKWKENTSDREKSLLLISCRTHMPDCSGLPSQVSPSHEPPLELSCEWPTAAQQWVHWVDSDCNEAPGRHFPSFCVSLFIPTSSPHPVTLSPGLLWTLLFLDTICSPPWNALFTLYHKVNFSNHNFLESLSKLFKLKLMFLSPSICASISTAYFQPYVTLSMCFPHRW